MANRKPKSLQTLVTDSLEKLIRKTCKTKVKWTPDLQGNEIGLNFSDHQLRTCQAITEYVTEIPPRAATGILKKLLHYTDEDEFCGSKKISAVEAFVLVHPHCTHLEYSIGTTKDKKRKPNRKVHIAILEGLKRCKHLQLLNLSSMDICGTDSEYNELLPGTDIHEHYLHVIEDILRQNRGLATVNLGCLVNNSICRVLSDYCRNLQNLTMLGPSEVTDLGLRYLVGQIQSDKSELGTTDISVTNDSPSEDLNTKKPGCLKLKSLVLNGIEKVSLATLGIVLLNLEQLAFLNHEKIHDALWLLDRAGIPDDFPGFSLTKYQGRGAAQCKSSILDILRKCSPKLRSLILGMTDQDTYLALGKFRNISHLSLSNISSVENLDLPLMAFGQSLIKLELKDCGQFQSGTSLQIRRFCSNLRSLTIEVTSVDNNSNSGISEALGQGPQSVWALQNQVMDLQSRLNQLQVTMLEVMGKYGPMAKLEELHLKNLSMGSILIILPFTPGLQTLSLKYAQDDSEGAAPNLTDQLFAKIFKKNQFQDLEELEVWCKTLTVSTAEWFLSNCLKLHTLKNVSLWNMNEEEQDRLRRDGRNRPDLAVNILY